MGNGSFSGVKRPGCGVDHPPPSSTEVKETVEFYLYSTSEPSWPVLGEIYFYICLYHLLFLFIFSTLQISRRGGATKIAPFTVTLFASQTVSPRNFTPLYLWIVTSVDSRLTILNEMKC